MLFFLAQGSCSSGTGRRNIIVIGRTDGSSSVSAYCFRLACSFVAFPLGALDSSSCCRFEAVFGVSSVGLPRFVVCATAVPIFLPSLPLTDGRTQTVSN